MVTGFSTMKTACSLATTHIAHSQELLRKRRRCWSLPDILFDVRFRYISFMAVAVRNNIEEQKSKIKKKKCRFWSRVGMGWIISGIHTHAPPPPILAHTHASLCTQNGRTVLYSRAAWEWDCVCMAERTRECVLLLFVHQKWDMRNGKIFTWRYSDPSEKPMLLCIAASDVAITADQHIPGRISP